MINELVANDISVHLFISLTVRKDMEEITVRKASEMDLQVVLQMIKELVEVDFGKELESRITITEAMLKEDGFGENQWFYCIVATNIKEEIVGYAFYHKAYSTWIGRRMNIEDIYVTQEHRGKGIGTRLLQAVTNDALKHNCNGMQWIVSNSNTSAIKFYRNVGAKLVETWTHCEFYKDEMKTYVQ